MVRYLILEAFEGSIRTCCEEEKEKNQAEFRGLSL